MSKERRALAWDHGVLAVQSLAGMLGPVLFLLPDGRQVSPLQVAPWGNDPQRGQLPGILRELRGDWACVPFGFDGPRDLAPGWEPTGETFDGADMAHGFGSNVDWQFTGQTETSLTLECRYPADHPVRLVRRIVTPDPAAPGISIALEIEVRRTCRLPIGLHPTFRLPPRPGSVIVEPAACRSIHTFPGDLEPGASLFAPGVRFDRLAEAPARGGGTVDVSALPLERDFEDIVQLAGIAGEVALHYPHDGFRARLTWNAGHFPSALLWMSNRGRTAYPWNGRHLALGIEPVASAFDLGPAISTGDNPISRLGIATALDFTPEAPFRTEYRIEVEPA